MSDATQSADEINQETEAEVKEKKSYEAPSTEKHSPLDSVSIADRVRYQRGVVE
jgi:hypothetical protein